MSERDVSVAEWQWEGKPNSSER